MQEDEIIYFASIEECEESKKASLLLFLIIIFDFCGSSCLSFLFGTLLFSNDRVNDRVNTKLLSFISGTLSLYCIILFCFYNWRYMHLDSYHYSHRPFCNNFLSNIIFIEIVIFLIGSILGGFTSVLHKWIRQ